MVRTKGRRVREDEERGHRERKRKHIVREGDKGREREWREDRRGRERE